MGETIAVNGFTIAQGMLYLGTPVQDDAGTAPPPALIDPKKPSTLTGDFTEPLSAYWSDYARMLSRERNAYLRWLADGKCHPDADIGYVFLYFYGLERRTLIDMPTDITVAAELPQIIGELQRLLAIYGGKSNSFNNYCAHLLDFLTLLTLPKKLYQYKVPNLPTSDALPALPYYLRLAIGQAAVDGVPIPAHLAKAWVEHDPAITRRTAATRCKDEFLALFPIKYRQIYGDGITFAPNRTKLRYPYHPAALDIRYDDTLGLRFDDIPDITALSTPIKKLQSIADACSGDLDTYSRLIGKHPDKRGSLEALLQLPAAIWPEQAAANLDALKKSVANQMRALPIQALFDALGGVWDSNKDSNMDSNMDGNMDAAKTVNNAVNKAVNKELLRGLCKALASENIGIAPDFPNITKTPQTDDTVIIFRAESCTAESRSTPAYRAAIITLELAAAVAHADGDFSDSELTALDTHITSWKHLATSQRLHLRAHARLLRMVPVPLAAMKKKVEPLDQITREAIASFTALMAQADGKVTHEEIKLLEKIYQLLGVEQSKVYSQLHAFTASGGNAPTNAASTTNAKTATSASAASPTVGFTLDAAKIAQLKLDSERLSALLGNIFADEPEPETAVPLPPSAHNTDPGTPAAANLLLGLDATHSAFARMLLSRPSWSRSALADVAQDFDVMLDGALEQLNEATLDAYDIVCAEGDDPIDINPEIVEKLEKLHA
jgi:tellurite resistance protein